MEQNLSSIVRKKEGGFNRVFIFTMDDNSRVVARLPFPLAGGTELATASEVATIQYCAWNNVSRGEDPTLADDLRL